MTVPNLPYHDWQPAEPPQYSGFRVRCSRCPATGVQPALRHIETEAYDHYGRGRPLDEWPEIVPDRPAYLDNCPLPMPDPIPPALTPAEWAAGAVDRVNLLAHMQPGLLVCRTPGDASVLADDDDLPALIALANAALPDDDPRKITRADVEAVQAAAGRIEGEWGALGPVGNRSEEHATELDALAAKLAALLPPD